MSRSLVIGHLSFCAIVAWEWHMLGSCRHLLLIPNFLPRLRVCGRRDLMLTAQWVLEGGRNWLQHKQVSRPPLHCQAQKPCDIWPYLTVTWTSWGDLMLTAQAQWELEGGRNWLQRKKGLDLCWSEQNIKHEYKQRVIFPALHDQWDYMLDILRIQRNNRNLQKIYLNSKL